MVTYIVLLASCILAVKLSEFVESPAQSGTCIDTLKPFSYVDIRGNTNMSPVMDVDYYKHFIAGNIDYCNTVAMAIAQSRDAHPDVARYIDFALSHGDQFSLYIRDVGEFTDLVDKTTLPLAYYTPEVKTITIASPMSTQIARVIRHEGRHRFWEMVHRLANAKDPHSVFCSMVDNPKEHKKIRQFITLGTKRIEHTYRLLIAEVDNRLTKEQQTYIDRHRRIAKQGFESAEFWEMSFQSDLLKQDIDQLNLNLTVGAVINIDKLIMGKDAFGDIEIVDVKPPNNLGLVKIKYKLLDPLQRMYRTLKEIQLSLRDTVNPYTGAKAYSLPHVSLYEFDAHLYGDMPAHLIRLYFKEMVEHVEKIIQLLEKKHLSSVLPATTVYKSYQTIIEERNAVRKSSPLYFDRHNAATANMNIDEFMALAYKYIIAGNFQLADYILEGLIQRRLNVAEASKYMGWSANLQGRHADSVRFFKNAQHLNYDLNSPELTTLGESLYKQGKLKEAKKVLTQALKKNTKALQQPLDKRQEDKYKSIHNEIIDLLSEIHNQDPIDFRYFN